LGRRRLPDFVFLVAAFAASLPGVTTRIYASDEINYYVYLRSLWFDRDLSFDNEYRYFYEKGISANPGFVDAFLERSTETGLRVNFGTLGAAILWAPFYAVADLAVRAFDLAPADGYSRPYVAAVCYASALYGFLAVWLSLGAAKRVVGEGSLAAAVLTWVGTPLLFYMYVAPPMAHACSAFAVALFVRVWLTVRETWSTKALAALGASAALMVMVREQDAFYAAGPAVDFGWTLARNRSDLVRRLVGVSAGALAFAALYVPQAAAYLVLNGRLGPSRLVTRKMDWWAPHAAGVLLSPEHGFLAWTPLAALSIVGLAILLARPGGDRSRKVAATSLVMLALQVYVSGSVESWTVAGAFGQRRFVGATVILVIGLAALLGRVRKAAALRALVGVVLAAAVYWNVTLMVQFGTGLMSRQKLELRRNLYTSFVVLPRELPGIFYRYLFERASFFKPPSSPQAP